MGFSSSATVSTFVGDGLSVSYQGYSSWASYDDVGNQTWFGKSIPLTSSDELLLIINTPLAVASGVLGEIIDLAMSFSAVETNTVLLNNFFHQGGATNIYYDCSYED